MKNALTAALLATVLILSAGCSGSKNLPVQTAKQAPSDAGSRAASMREVLTTKIEAKGKP